MRILVTGSRYFDDYNVLHAAIFSTLSDFGVLSTEAVIIQGGARGADKLAREFCASQEVGCVTFPADWAKYGRVAGFTRNQEMVDSGADICLAFFKVGEKNAGTLDCVQRALLAGIPVRAWSA